MSRRHVHDEKTLPDTWEEFNEIKRRCPTAYVTLHDRIMNVTAPT